MIKSKKILNLLLGAAIISSSLVLPKNINIYTTNVQASQPKKDIKKIYDFLYNPKRNTTPHIFLNYCDSDDGKLENKNFGRKCTTFNMVFVYMVAKELEKDEDFTKYMKKYYSLKKRYEKDLNEEEKKKEKNNLVNPINKYLNEDQSTAYSKEIAKNAQKYKRSYVY